MNLIKYRDEKAVVKELLEQQSDKMDKVFAKEALLLHRIKNDNIVKLLMVCPNPKAIMMEYLVFSFKPFSIDLEANNLGSLLQIIDQQNFSSSLKLHTKIARDNVSAIMFLHQNDIVHRDIKPKNILVSNLHYCDQDIEHAGRTFQSCPIVCKLADLGESRATFAQTYADKMTHTRFLKRGTLPFMAPEIHVEKYMLNGASLDDLKKVDVWALKHVKWLL